MTFGPERIKQIEDAFALMKSRGMGFTSIGNPNALGFGDPATPVTAVGPFDGVLVEFLASDPDPVEAVRKAVAAYDARK